MNKFLVQFFEFARNHWPLFLAMVAVIMAIVYEELRSKIGGISRLAPHEVTNLINHEDAVVLDLRTQAVFSGGHIINAVNIQAADIESQLQKIAQYKTCALVLVDNTDASAAGIAAKLKKQGFEKVFVLAGGINAWKNASLPLTKS